MTSTNRNASASPSRRISFSNTLQALGAKLSRTLSHDVNGGTPEEDDSVSVSTLAPSLATAAR
ncbi:hypothetical protein Hypma_002243 [Hypsizygus marmoreus]|uniref:Uncharacterized protein n=1 Tax=Hypsizygus marmoreus TaxID=39966 RepID=A0A369K889_HYPMA|nr:hypothetical protein Hypma_002243 [Hypsizygus marmoreus]